MAQHLLVVVDYQVDFVSGTLGFPGADRLDSRIAARIRSALQDGYDVLFTFDTHSANYLQTREGRTLPVEHTIRNTPGHELYGEVDRVFQECSKDPACDGQIIVADKTTFGLAPEVIHVYLHSKDYETIELCGLVSNMCVISNACCLQAAFPEAQIIVDATLTDSFDKDLHYQTLAVLQGMQVQIVHMPQFAIAVKKDGVISWSYAGTNFLYAIQEAGQKDSVCGGEVSIIEVPDDIGDTSRFPVDDAYIRSHLVRVVEPPF